MAVDGEKAADRAQVDRVRELARSQIEGPLANAVEGLERPTRWFVDEAEKHATEILAGAAPQQAEVEDVELRIEAAGHERTARIVTLSSLVGFGLLAAAVLDALPGWSFFVAGAVLAGGFAFAWVGRRGARRVPKPTTTSTGSGPSNLALPDQLSAAEAAYEQSLELAVQRWLTDLANEKIGEIYETELPELDPTGLAEIDDPDQDVRTTDAEKLEGLIARMPGGSIGVSGPRGAGKSTLLKRLTAGAQRKDSKQVAVAILVDAPVEYDGREFVLHLFAQLCEAVLGPARVQTMRDWRSTFGQPTGRLWRFSDSRLPYPLSLGFVLLAVGLAALVFLNSMESKAQPSDFVPWATALTGLGAVLILPALPVFPLRLLAYFRLDRPRSRDLRSDAERQLRQIWFQRTFTSGWSGGLKVPLGIEAGVEQGTQLAENQLSFPDIVTLYKEFIGRIVKEEGQVRIGVDELDKMDDERARRFLDEIKVIFRVTGCFYFVSVSEDAMAYFERRGLPFRDVFDSSFDDVRKIEYLDYADSLKLLRRRVVGMPVQFVALCHALGGGLARDVIRVARDVSAQPGGTPLDEVTAELCTRQLRMKCAAARVGVRRLENPIQVLLLSRWLGSIEAAAPSVDALFERCCRFQTEFATRLGRSPTTDPVALEEHRDTLSIALEIVAFAYFVAVLREQLSKLDTEERARTAIHDETIDRLGKARQAFAFNPGEAWEAIAALRPLRPPAPVG